jgi:hypothetical protein
VLVVDVGEVKVVFDNEEMKLIKRINLRITVIKENLEVIIFNILYFIK